MKLEWEHRKVWRTILTDTYDSYMLLNRYCIFMTVYNLSFFVNGLLQEPLCIFIGNINLKVQKAAGDKNAILLVWVGRNSKTSEKLAENTKWKKESILLKRDGPEIWSVDATEDCCRKFGNIMYKIWPTVLLWSALLERIM